LEILSSNCEVFKSLADDEYSGVDKLIDDVNYFLSDIVNAEKEERWVNIAYVWLYLAIVVLLALGSIFTQNAVLILILIANLFVGLTLIYVSFDFENESLCSNKIALLSFSYEKFLYSSKTADVKSKIKSKIRQWCIDTGDKLNVRVQFSGIFYEILQFNFGDEEEVLDGEEGLRTE